MRAAPEATSLLARSGVTRGFNWLLSFLLLAAVGIASVWPTLHAFLAEIIGNPMARIPAYDVFGEIAALAPALPGWRVEPVLSTGLSDGLAALGFVPMDQLTEILLFGGGALLALLAFSARSWRLVYIPALAALALAAGSILGGAEATLYICGGSLALFALGGMVNRTRDAGRFNARVARLSEHVLRNPPQEGVRASEKSSGDATPAAAPAAAAAIATAAAVAEGGEAAGTSDDDAAAIAADADAGDPADPSETATNGEVTARDDADVELPPVASETETEETAPEPAEETNAEQDEAETSEETDEPVEAAALVMSDDDGETAPQETTVDPEQPAAENTPEDDDPAADDTVVEAAAAVTPESTPEAEVAPEDFSMDDTETASVTAQSDDDLPSLDDVAAAAALTETEGAESESPETETDRGAALVEANMASALEDDRTMPVASPPPMPAIGDEEPSASASEAAETAEVDGSAVSWLDDPLMDDTQDPMVPKASDSDLAPGAPEIELEPDPAE